MFYAPIRMRKVIGSIGLTVLLLLLSVTASASQEGTRHITGKDIDIYFMNDKIFGHIGKNPLWAIYNCGTDIKGEVDIDGTYQSFAIRFHRTGDQEITGTFGSRKIGMRAVKRKKLGFVYEVFVGEKLYSFSISYQRLEEEHMVSSVIEGHVGDAGKIKMVVDNHLCPFATAGIILVVAASITS